METSPPQQRVQGTRCPSPGWHWGLDQKLPGQGPAPSSPGVSVPEPGPRLWGACPVQVL